MRQAVLVDDDRSCLALVNAWMIAAGFEVHGFTDFVEAKRHLITHTPDVLICDVRLGLFNGMQLVVTAKQQHPELVAVVFTGFDDPVLSQDAAKVGAHFLVKPASAEALLAIIEAHSARS